MANSEISSMLAVNSITCRLESKAFGFNSHCHGKAIEPCHDFVPSSANIMNWGSLASPFSGMVPK